MLRNKLMYAAAIASLLIAGNALAQSGNASTKAEGQAAMTTKAHDTEANASGNAAAEVTAKMDQSAQRKAIEQRAAKVSAKTVAKADAELKKAANSIESKADHSEQVASRLAMEFKSSTQAILQEKSETDASWGDLTIAHTLAINSKSGLTVKQLIELKHDGMGWGTIAAGLGMNLGSAVSSVKAETNVAKGLAKADGHVGTNGQLGVNAGAGLQHGAVGATAAGGLGVKLGH
jgi:hypothetical protein